MKCEEFETMGLDAERDASLSEAERAAAREHVTICSRCAALRDSWRATRRELRLFAEATAAAKTPARAEMRLRQEFRTQHRTLKVRRAAVITAWALAAAAVLIGAVSWRNWRSSRQEEAAIHQKSPQTAAGISANGNSGAAANREALAGPAAGVQPSSAPEIAGAEVLMASMELSGFTPLPGVLPSDTDEAAILRVRMQRGALGALGLPINEERASDWIQVDLLVGNDGLPQAVRLPQ